MANGGDRVPSLEELRPLVELPLESLGAEYKDWLDLRTEHGRATIAKHAIALANHGGGHIVLGFSEQADELVSHHRPEEVPAITQDSVNEAIRRYCDPGFHCEMNRVNRPDTGVSHPVITVPGTLSTPVMSRRDHQGVIRQYGCYIRKQGPRSEVPQTHSEWRTLLDRCVRATRTDLLDSIRSIVVGQVEAPELGPDARERLLDFCADARDRWGELASNLPVEATSRFPLGYQEIGLSLVGAVPAGSFNEIERRLALARGATAFSGWPLFLNLRSTALEQYIYRDFVEAWVGRPESNRFVDEPFYSDFWRVSVDGDLYSIQGYIEDGLPQQAVPGKAFDIGSTIRRIGEALIFARAWAELFEGVEQIIIRCRLTGLDGRSLVSLGAFTAFHRVFPRVCHTDLVELQGQATPQQVEDNLAEVVHTFLRPLYERFNFYELRLEAVQRVLQEMRR